MIAVLHGMIKRGWKDLQQALGFGQDNEEVDNDELYQSCNTSGDINQSLLMLIIVTKDFTIAKALNSALEGVSRQFFIL